MSKGVNYNEVKYVSKLKPYYLANNHDFIKHFKLIFHTLLQEEYKKE